MVSVFKDNAGGIEFYDDWVVTIKGETHNFHSSIAPFGGVATKHGGVIRDTLGFGKGAYPIGGTTVMGTMSPRLPEDDVPPGALHPQLIVTESIRATAYYCNPMGIPMMHPRPEPQAGRISAQRRELNQHIAPILPIAGRNNRRRMRLQRPSQHLRPKLLVENALVQRVLIDDQHPLARLGNEIAIVDLEGGEGAASERWA